VTGRSDERWRSVATETVAAVDALWAAGGPQHWWTKPQDASLVSDFEYEIDLTLRRILARHYPGVPVISEELGWLGTTVSQSLSFEDRHLVAIMDPVDGSSDLAAGGQEWWVVLALQREGLPSQGLVYQPVRKVLHSSASSSAGGKHVRACLTSTSKNATEVEGDSTVVGVNPWHVDAHDEVFRALVHEGLTPVAVPFAVEKVTSVIEGRCDGAVYVPSEFAPDWRACDLAASLPLARARGFMLRALDGNAIELKEMTKRMQLPWVCARNSATLRAIQAALGG
jgi:fructose-1,6-bisphosphatase/inositol monophosphatase family enzyme